MARRPAFASTLAQQAILIPGRSGIPSGSTRSSVPKFVAPPRTGSVYSRGGYAKASSPHRNMWPGAGPRLGSALVDRYLAIAYALLIHPLWAEPLLPARVPCWTAGFGGGRSEGDAD